MPIDVHTLAIILSLSSLMQVAALYIQHRLDHTHGGTGWWAIGSAAMACAFLGTNFRAASALGRFAIVANNVLLLGGFCCLYIGILRFLGRRENLRWLAAVWCAISLSSVYYTFADYNVSARRVVFSAAVGVISFAIARLLCVHKLPAVSGSAYFLAAVFIVEGCVIGARAFMPLLGVPVEDAFNSSAAQIGTYLIALITSTLWTFGFIILVNQRLITERHRKILDLQAAAEQIQALNGILPICAQCKKIREDDGYWEQVDAYIAKRSEAEFSHGICPDCAVILYPAFPAPQPGR